MLGASSILAFSPHSFLLLLSMSAACRQDVLVYLYAWKKIMRFIPIVMGNKLVPVHCYFFFSSNNQQFIRHDTLMLRNNYGIDLERPLPCALPPLVSCCNADGFVLSYLPQARLTHVTKTLPAGPGLGVRLGCNQLLPVAVPPQPAAAPLMGRVAAVNSRPVWKPTPLALTIIPHTSTGRV